MDWYCIALFIHSMIDGYCSSHNLKNGIRFIANQAINYISFELGVKNYLYLKNNEEFYSKSYNNESKFYNQLIQRP